MLKWKKREKNVFWNSKQVQQWRLATSPVITIQYRKVLFFCAQSPRQFALIFRIQIAYIADERNETKNEKTYIFV